VFVSISAARALLTIRHDRIAKQQQVALQRERALEHFEPVVWKVVQWLRANKNQLRGRVFEPPRLYLGVKKELNGQKLDLSRDPHIVDLVEGPIPLNAFSVSAQLPLSLAPRRMCNH